jgi:hypothetical protein
VNDLGPFWFSVYPKWRTPADREGFQTLWRAALSRVYRPWPQLRFGGFESADNKAWVIDQMCRALLGDAYEQFVANARAGEEGAETYSWDTGIAP